MPSRLNPTLCLARLFVIIAIAMNGLASPLQSADTFHDGIQRLTKTSGFENGQWGILVVDALTKQVLFEQNANQMFAPASVTKLYSTAAALEKLGPDYHRRAT